MGIQRDDWNYTNDKANTDPLPGSTVPVPVTEPRYLTPTSDPNYDYTTQDEPIEADPIAGMSPEQLNLAGTAAQMILETCPVDEEWFAEQFDTLSPGAQKAI